MVHLRWLLAAAAFLIAACPLRSQWFRQESGTTAHLSGIAILGSQSAVVVGDRGTILKTTDGGSLWQVVSSGTVKDLHAVSFSRAGAGIAVGDRIICRSTDGGDTWTADPFPANGISVAFGAADLPVAYVGTDAGEVLYSEDGGGHWTGRTVTGNRTFAVTVGYGALQDYYLFLATDQYLYDKRAGRDSWDSVPIPSTTWDAFAGGYLSFQHQIIVGSTGDFALQPLILRRNLADSSWTRLLDAQGGYALNSIAAFDDSDLAFACGSSGVILKLTHNADSVSVQNSGTPRNLRAIAFADHENGFAAGDSGTILSTTNGGVTGVPTPGTLPPQFGLEQNYPNPFNPGTQVRFRIPSSQFVTLNVYDILGREIATLVNEVKLPGEYSVEWEARNQPSGVYYCRLQAGSFVQTKKIVHLE